ncbi:hypothetical protein CcaverHIS002_0200290 [Cutaneotrichosporon cavernicola]|nr:hypothetical protein CcaverHIS002_0200290 [Cutaneotrichosporon cavernicola]
MLLPSSSQPLSQPPHHSSSSTVVGFFSKLLRQTRPVVVEPERETEHSYSAPTRASLAKDIRVEMATKENLPPVGSPQWYGSTVSSASDTTHASRHTTPKRTVQRALIPMEDTTTRPASAPANTLGLTTEVEAGSDEPLRRPLSEMSKADVCARRRESKTNSPASTKSQMSTKSALSTKSLPSVKSPLSTRSAVSTKSAVSSKSVVSCKTTVSTKTAVSIKSTAPKTPKTESVHKSRSLKSTTPNPVPSYAAPTSASRASAAPTVRRQPKSPAPPASTSKVASGSPAKVTPVARRRRNTLTKTPKSLRISTTYKSSPSIAEKGSPCRRAEAWANALPSSPRRRSSANPVARDPLCSPLSPKLPRVRTRKTIEHARAKLAGNKVAMPEGKMAVDAGIRNGDSPVTLRSKTGYNDTPQRTTHLTDAAVSTPTKRSISKLQAKAAAKHEVRALLKASRNRVNGPAAELIAAAQEVLGGAVKDLEESRSPPTASQSLAAEAQAEPVCCKCRASLSAAAESSGSSTPSEKILIPTSPPRPFLGPPFLAEVGSLAAQLARRRSSLTPLVAVPISSGFTLPPIPPTGPTVSSLAKANPTSELKPMQAMLHATPEMLQAAVQGLKHIVPTSLPVPSAAPRVAAADIQITSGSTSTTTGVATTVTTSVSAGPRIPSPPPPSTDQGTPSRSLQGVLAPVDLIKNARFGLKPVGNAHGAAVRNERRLW